MDTLFQASLAGQQYDVTFADERYNFQPGAGGASFFLMRTHDQWEGDAPEGLRSEAISALEDYLLQQH